MPEAEALKRRFRAQATAKSSVFTLTSPEGNRDWGILEGAYAGKVRNITGLGTIFHRQGVPRTASDLRPVWLLGRRDAHVARSAAGLF